MASDPGDKLITYPTDPDLAPDPQQLFLVTTTNYFFFHRKIKILLLVPGVHCQARGRRNIEVPWTKSKKLFQELFLHDSFEQFDGE
jgi:hypothetical protein